MSQDPKVVSIKPNLAARASAGASLLPTPLLTVRDQTTGYLQQGLGDVFDKADDALFEMADKAASNAEQTLFFEAMRSVRLQRANLIRKTCDGVVLAAEQLASDAPAPVQAVSFELDSLSLVQPDELEQSVAVDGMISRVVARNQTGLSHLALRVNSLARKRVDERNCPFAPAPLIEHFADALQALDINIKVRLIILKLFERCVLNGIDSLYESLNDALVNAGVMPDLRLAPVAQTRRPVAPRGTGEGRVDAPAPGPARAGYGSEEQQEVLGLFSELIGKWRMTSGDMALSGLSGASAVPMQSNELLQVLSSVSPEHLTRDAGSAGLRQQIQALLQEQRKSHGGGKTVARVDDDVISLVSMLFDFILEDRELPSAVKVLITRLQLPVLRVAIVDKSFFSRASHPARRLLNELSRATMGWNEHDDLRRDQLHALLEDIVEQLLAEAEPDAALFDSLNQRLAEILRTEQRRAERIEQRTRDAEEGRARIQAARSEVAREINGLLVGRTLPVTLVDLLRDTWSQVMQMVFLREGGESMAWQQARDTAMALVVSVEPVDEAGRELRIEQNRQTEAALRGGLELLGLDAAAIVAQLQAVAQSQRAALALAEKPQRLPENAAPDAEAPMQAPVVELSPSDAEEREPAPQPEQEPVVVAAVHIEQPVLAQEELETPVETVDDLPSVGAQRWIESLGTGCWFQLQPVDGKAGQRCKLAAIISFSGKYIFVNRNGLKVAEFGRQELARCFDEGRISLLDENQLFDRALESVIGNLRQLHAKS